MMSMRAFTRAAPRTLTRLSSATLRQTAVARPSSMLKASYAPLRTSQYVAPFSTTPFRQAAANEVDEDLSQKLESELQFESEMKESEQHPASIKDFLENSPFELVDTPGKENVILKRNFGSET
jgi:complement component 1 Q subcomponent-binding protein, mitochondrial